MWPRISIAVRGSMTFGVEWQAEAWYCCCGDLKCMEVLGGRSHGV